MGRGGRGAAGVTLSKKKGGRRRGQNGGMGTQRPQPGELERTKPVHGGLREELAGIEWPRRGIDPWVAFPNPDFRGLF